MDKGRLLWHELKTSFWWSKNWVPLHGLEVEEEEVVGV